MTTGGDAIQRQNATTPNRTTVPNRVTYRDRRLRGGALTRGLALFYAACGLGAAANVGVATLLLQDGVLAWGMAGVAGALITVVWNYAVSSTLVGGGSR